MKKKQGRTLKRQLRTQALPSCRDLVSLSFRRWKNATPLSSLQLLSHQTSDDKGFLICCDGFHEELDFADSACGIGAEFFVDPDAAAKKVTSAPGCVILSWVALGVPESTLQAGVYNCKNLEVCCPFAVVNFHVDNTTQGPPAYRNYRVRWEAAQIGGAESEARWIRFEHAEECKLEEAFERNKLTVNLPKCCGILGNYVCNLDTTKDMTATDNQKNVSYRIRRVNNQSLVEFIKKQKEPPQKEPQQYLFWLNSSAAPSPDTGFLEEYIELTVSSTPQTRMLKKVGSVDELIGELRALPDTARQAAESMVRVLVTPPSTGIPAAVDLRLYETRLWESRIFPRSLVFRKTLADDIVTSITNSARPMLLDVTQDIAMAVAFALFRQHRGPALSYFVPNFGQLKQSNQFFRDVSSYAITKGYAAMPQLNAHQKPPLPIPRSAAPWTPFTKHFLYSPPNISKMGTESAKIFNFARDYVYRFAAFYDGELPFLQRVILIENHKLLEKFETALDAHEKKLSGVKESLSSTNSIMADVLKLHFPKVDFLSHYSSNIALAAFVTDDFNEAFLCSEGMGILSQDAKDRPLLGFPLPAEGQKRLAQHFLPNTYCIILVWVVLDANKLAFGVAETTPISYAYRGSASGGDEQVWDRLLMNGYNWDLTLPFLVLELAKPTPTGE